MSIATRPLALTINGQQHGPIEVPVELMMLDYLHEYANLTGTRFGCGQGMCRACTVIVDQDDGSSHEMRTCITGAHYFNGRRIRTVEGHAQRDEDGEVLALAPIQQSFLEHYSFQCSYCAPGFVNAATVLIERLQREPVARDQLEDTISDALNDHICRCTGYVRYLAAVRDTILSTPGLVKEA
ncbi:Aerobic-type carbon monoxide dehydrogenase, small subunit, CoxS/CutS family [Modicisalibacter muralis]|uniref:Aerobic-type carbon monoxide dehydrogenase, small subunit, CoxS/CutS family n=1 Tax=Modicisalibacter muralis TaxID=119000 RepID=A0A1G9QBT8_9GAMM|nr:(2Fe-2S)-binding protein [Halomonas muralis]SDM08390.1 Aerobic-type carbon monoxide dehydrogenase, small subunit, CoxS/CutS family [Halomonas muralis]